MSCIPRSSSLFQRNKSDFYLTSFHPSSYYSLNKSPLIQPNIRIHSSDNKNSSIIYKEDECNDYPEKSIDIFRSKVNRSRPSPFYNNEKSLRLQDEIDWINKIIGGNTKINKFVEDNSTINFIKNPSNDINGLLRCQVKLDQLNNLNENRNNKLIYKKFNYMDSYLNHRENPCPIIINSKYRKNGLFNKNDLDDYNYRVFMNQMVNFKNNRVNKWKNDFNNKFNQY